MRSTRQRSTLVGLPNASKSLDRAKSIVTANHDTVSLFINNSSELITALYWDKVLDRIARATPLDFTAWAGSDEPLSSWFDSYGTGSASLDATNGIVFSGVYFLVEKATSPRLPRALSSCASISKAPSLTVDQSFYGLGFGYGTTDVAFGEGQIGGSDLLARLILSSGSTSASINSGGFAVTDRSNLCVSQQTTAALTESIGPLFYGANDADRVGNGTLVGSYPNVLPGRYRLIIGQRPIGANVATMDFSVTSLD